jgi:predicted kinase
MRTYKELVQVLENYNDNHIQTEMMSHKAIFVTGGPGSGKDIILREAFSNISLIEHNFTQILSILGDKQNISKKSNDLRKESIRNRQSIIINGSATDLTNISYIKEELEELGYDTMMVFVSTTNEFSIERNSSLVRMVSESIRCEKWLNSQKNLDVFYEMFDNFILFENTEEFKLVETGIIKVIQHTDKFLNEAAVELNIPKSVSKFTKPNGKPNNLLFDNNIKPELKIFPVPKIKNFDKDKESSKKLSTTSSTGTIKTPGVGPEYDTRGSGTVYPMSGLGNVSYSEQKNFKNFRNAFKEDIQDNDNEMGISGGCTGASNKEPLITPMDKFGTSGLSVKIKKKKV